MLFSCGYFFDFDQIVGIQQTVDLLRELVSGAVAMSQLSVVVCPSGIHFLVLGQSQVIKPPAADVHKDRLVGGLDLWLEDVDQRGLGLVPPFLPQPKASLSAHPPGKHHLFLRQRQSVVIPAAHLLNLHSIRKRHSVRKTRCLILVLPSQSPLKKKNKNSK